MELFLTIEGERCTENGLAKILADTTKQLDFVTSPNRGLQDVNNYGTEFRLVSIIPTCVSDDVWNGLGWKERKRFLRKAKEAEIRLRMDYDHFIKETPANKRQMFIDILIESIRAVQAGSKGDFQGEKLISDILQKTIGTQGDGSVC